MKTNKTPASSAAPCVGMQNDHSKLVSLLALAAGAAAMPQTSNADIIFTDQTATVSWEGVHAFVINNLPGNAQFGFQANQSGPSPATSVRLVTEGKRGGGYLMFKTALVTQPLLWSQIGGAPLSVKLLATAQLATHTRDAFSGKYMAFEFKDSSQAGSPMRFGWVGLSLANGNLNSGSDFPALTVVGWAYDSTGAQIRMGVPEPSSIALLALGALTLGAKGVRSWRRNRAAAS